MSKVTPEQIEKIMSESEFMVCHKIFDKQCIVVAKLQNGFTIVGESACVDPANYDNAIGEKLAKDRIREKLWELEGYTLQKKLSGDL